MRSLRYVAGAPLMAAAGWIGYSTLFVRHNLVLPPPIESDWHELFGRSGRLAYYVGGRGRPALLVHSVNAAASAYEMRPIFEALVNSHRVYAFDLPGFGWSDRSRRDYTVPLYVDAVRDMIDQIEAQCGREPIDVVALSLGCEFAASAAMAVPDRISTLALVSPTGLDPWQTMRHKAAVERALSFPVWSQAAYDLLVTEPSLRYFLRKVWGRDEVDEELVRFAYRTSHQRDARHAPFAFLSGALFTRDIERTYRALPHPTWIAHGTRGEFALTSDQLEPVPANWRTRAFDAGGMPQFECPVEFVDAYKGFLDGVAAAAIAPEGADSAAGPRIRHSSG